MVSFQLSRRRPGADEDDCMRKGLERQLPARLRHRHALQAALQPVGPAAVPGPRRRPVQGDPRRAAPRSSPTTIETFTETGIQLASGAELDADVIVTATGLNLLALGGMRAAPSTASDDRAARDDGLQGHDAQRRPEPRVRARLHERLVDAQVRPDLRVRVPAAQAHGRARLRAVHARATTTRSVDPRSRSSTSPPATCCARSTSSRSRGRRRRGGCTRTTRATSSRSATARSRTGRSSSAGGDESGRPATADAQPVAA